MAEGFKDFAPGDILTAADVDDYLMQQSVMVFADASARTTALTAVLREGMMSYLKDTNAVEVYDGSAWTGVGGVDGVAVEFLVVGGGGGSSSGAIAGGGGGGGHIKPAYNIFAPLSTNIAVTIGAGGATGSNGSDTSFYGIVGYGGGKGAPNDQNGFTGANGGGAGGSGTSSYTGGVANTPVGYNGGNSFAQPGVGPAGGGGGAGGNGGNAVSNVAGDGGIGVSSSITGSAVGRAGGGGGGIITGTPGSGNDGGGNGATGGAGVAGTANTGGGGGGGAGAGGSGVVILRYLTASATISVGAGLTSSSATDGDYTVVTITAGSDNVSWS